MGEKLIKYRNVSVYQEEFCVLDNINIELSGGEFVYIIGKVGSGKTSLLKTFYGELDIADGRCEVLNFDMSKIKRKNLPKLRRQLGIVFQDFQLMTDRNVTQNLEFVLKATGWKDKKMINERIGEVLDQVGMKHKGYKHPSELSGGEQQRIVIARAILNSPRIILADEPTGNLDEETGDSIVELLRSFAGKGTLVVMTTHNMKLLEKFPSKTYRCDKHEIVDITSEFN